jgi:hypothetical protein
MVNRRMSAHDTAARAVYEAEARRGRPARIGYDVCRRVLHEAPEIT